MTRRRASPRTTARAAWRRRAGRPALPRRWHGWSAGLALVAVLMMTACDKTPVVVPVQDAAKHDGARRLTLTGSKIALELGGRYERICSRYRTAGKGQTGCADHHFYVFPVVAADRKPKDPVTAWVTCANREKSLDACRKAAAKVSGDVSGRVAVRTGDEHKALRARSGWEKAVANALDTHKLTTPISAPVIYLPKAAKP